MFYTEIILIMMQTLKGIGAGQKLIQSRRFR